MYRIEIKDNEIVGVDAAGKRQAIFSAGNYLRNKSRVPEHRLVIADGGSYLAEMIWIHTISKRFQEIQDAMRDGVQEYAWIIVECQIADYLLEQAAPVQIAFVDVDEYSANRFEGMVHLFKNDHEIYRISTEKFCGFQAQGFGLVIVAADDRRAEEQVRLAARLLSSKGRLICIERKSVLFREFLKLVADECEEYHVAEECAVRKVESGAMRQELLAETDFDETHADICRSIHEILDLADENEVKTGLRQEAVRIQHHIKEAQRRWDLKKKQEFLDLKEKVQYYLLNIEDDYAAQYREELLEILD